MEIKTLNGKQIITAFGELIDGIPIPAWAKKKKYDGYIFDKDGDYFPGIYSFYKGLPFSIDGSWTSMYSCQIEWNTIFEGNHLCYRTPTFEKFEDVIILDTQIQGWSYSESFRDGMDFAETLPFDSNPEEFVMYNVKRTTLMKVLFSDGIQTFPALPELIDVLNGNITYDKTLALIK